MSWKKLELLPEFLGQRIDKVLSTLPEVNSRSRASFLIENHHVQVNQKPCKMSHLIKPDDQITYQIPESSPTGIVSYDFPLEIEYEDEDLLVINKPAGLVVHPSAGHQSDTLVNALVAKGYSLSMKFGEDRPGIVHRLDKETSGLIVVAKNDFTHESLAKQFKDRNIHRIYQALVFGNPRPEQGTISSYLARHPTSRKKFASLLDRSRQRITEKNDAIEVGKWAVTHYKILQKTSSLSLLQLKLETGRTHQIRVHLSELGFPIVGDTLYGADRKVSSVKPQSLALELKSLDRFYLHAAELGFAHPRSLKQLSFKKNWPVKNIEDLSRWGINVSIY